MGRERERERGGGGGKEREREGGGGRERGGGREKIEERERERERAVIYVFSSFFRFITFHMRWCLHGHGRRKGDGECVLSPGREISGASLP